MSQPKQPKKPTPYDTPTPEKIAMGERMRAAREIAGMTITEVAAQIGYAQPVHLSLMETGQRPVTLHVLMALVPLYGTTADYICGFAADSDRDPMAAVQMHVAARMAAELQRLTRHVTATSIDIVRELMPSASEGLRLAGLALETRQSLQRLRELNKSMDDDLRGLATHLAKVEMTAEVAASFIAKVEKAKRVTAAKSMRHATNAVQGKLEQISLLPPALDSYSERATA